MSISKLLMTAAICTMSMSASMSFGAFESKLNEGDHTASASSLTPLSSSGFGVGKSGRLEADVRSVGSSMSTINPERLVPALRQIMGALKDIPRDVIFPGDTVKTAVGGSKPTQLDIIFTAVKNLVTAYKGLAIIASEANKNQSSLELVLAKVKGENIEVPKDSVEAEIVAEMNAKALALKDAETRAIKAESSKIAWKIAAVISSGLLVAVVGVLINIFNAHGFEIIFLQKAE